MFIFRDLGYLTEDRFFSSSIHLHANFKMSFLEALSSTQLCKCTILFKFILQLKDKSSDLGLVNIFSHIVGCLFVLLTVSFALQKLLSFKRFHLFVIVFSV